MLRDISPDAYLVGGSVRDLVRSQPPADYDLSVSASPRSVSDELAQRIGGHVVLLGGRGHELFRVVGSGVIIDICQMKGRDIIEDLFDRDFSINAMACRLTDGAIIDPAGGLKDLERGTVRMLGPQVFDNDPLRLLRAYRMAASLDFRIDAETQEAIGQKADRIYQAAGERIWCELRQILTTPASHRQIAAMAQSTLLTNLFPELIPLQTCTQNRHHALNAFDHSLSAYTALETILALPHRHVLLDYSSDKAIGLHFAKTGDDIFVLLKFSILLHDVGKPKTRSMDTHGRIHFYGHAGYGADLVRQITGRLRMSSRESHLAEFMVRRHHDPLLLYLAHQKNKSLSPRARARFFRKCADLSPWVLIHALADEMGKGLPRNTKNRQTDTACFLRGLLAFYFEQIAPLHQQPGLIDGRELMQRLHLKPSPLVGKVLKEIETARLAGEIHDRDGAIAWAKEYLTPKNRNGIKINPASG